MIRVQLFHLSITIRHACLCGMLLMVVCVPTTVAQREGTLSQHYEQERRAALEKAQLDQVEEWSRAFEERQLLERESAEKHRQQARLSAKTSLLPDPINVQDSLALVALYNSTSGANWDNNTNWLTGRVPDWFGITVDGSRVTGIELGNNSLSGPLPDEIGDLDALQSLSLWQNLLTGEIPTELSQLASLESLNLRGNLFTGTIPPELGQLSSLKFLWLYSNLLEGTIPPELGDLKALETLDLLGNQLEGSIPPELGSMTALSTLSLWDNQLTGAIPPELGNLRNLTWLGLWDNQLSGSIPPELGDLPLLGTLVLYENQLSGEIPSELANLANLEVLNIRNNLFSGGIPKELKALSKLRALSLRNNSLTGEIPVELGDLSELTFLGISTNQLTGEIPPELGNLANLEFLWLFNNQLSGEIPSELGNLTNLLNLLISDNNFDGSIPPELGGLSEATFINMRGNQLTGSIPPALGDLPKLDNLNLGNNQLTGSIPPELGNLGNLTNLELQENALTGSIPPELGSLSNLAHLQLYHNQLTGSLPPELGDLSKLISINFDNNSLSGALPPEYGNWRSLTSLAMPNNQFTGSIPPEWGQMSNLEYLWLYLNDLSGALTSELSNLSRLKLLDLGDNEFTGALPSTWVNMPNMEGFFFYNNYVEDLPDMSSMSKLNNLAMEGNKLTFEDIEPNLGIPNFQYCCQRIFGEEQTISVGEGESLTLQFSVGGTNNTYQWRKNGSDITDAHSDTHVINPVTADDAASYELLVNNTLATDLTLYSGPITVNVRSAQPVTFQVDMSGELFNVQPGEVIGVRGSEAPLSWEDTTPLSDNDGDGIYSGSVAFAVDLGTEIQYKFIHNTPDNSVIGWEGSVGPGGDSGNRVLTFNGSETLDVVYWNNNTPPSAVISTDVTAGIAPLTVHFDASSSSDPDGSITNYHWDFDDGGSATGATTNHTFSSSGSYEVVLTVTDNSGAKTATSETISVINYPSSVSYSINRTFSTATSASSYRLVALPGDVKVGMAATLSGSSGADNDWRAFRDTGGSGSVESYLSEYDGSDAFTFKAGRGFWLLSKQAWSHAQEVSTAPLSSDGSTSISVHDGWNIISNPFDVNVTWASVLAFNGLGNTTPLYRFNGSFSQVSTFTTAKTSGEAFYFNNATGLSTLKVPYPSTGVVLPREVEPLLEEALELRASRYDSVEVSVRVGFADQAAFYNQVAPPAHFEVLGLRILEDGKTWATAVQKRSGRGSSFNLALYTSEAGSVVITAAGLASFESEEVVLLDEQLARSYDLHGAARVEVNVAHAGVHGFKLLIGDRAYVDGEIEVLVLPEEVILHGNYPNPFQSQTVIEYGVPSGLRGESVRLEVYDVLGRRVVVLDTGKKESGYHRVLWDGRDATGVKVASGLYVSRLQVGKTLQAQTMTLIR